MTAITRVLQNTYLVCTEHCQCTVLYREISTVVPMLHVAYLFVFFIIIIITTCHIKDLKPLGVYQNPDLEKLDQQKRLHQAITKRQVDDGVLLRSQQQLVYTVMYIQEFKMSQERKAPRVRSHSCLITPADSQHKVCV